MSAAGTPDYETIIETVHNWPPSRRLHLVQDVLRSLASDMEPQRPRRNTLERALGLLANERPAPSDEEIQQRLDEHRVEKYG
jgi:hypothetical protein